MNPPTVQITEADVRRAVGELYSFRGEKEKAERMVYSMPSGHFRGGWYEDDLVDCLCDLLGLAKETTDDAKV